MATECRFENVREIRPLGALDWFAIVLFVFGSYLNNGGEFGRYFFKRDPADKCKLYTKDLFSYAMHINFFGDILWVSADHAELVECSHRHRADICFC